MTDNTKKIELIKQMLAKAESTNHPAEAETFTAAAEKMMLRLGIDEAMLNSSSDEKPTVVEKTMVFSGSYHLGKMHAAMTIAQAMGSVFVMQAKLRNQTQLYLVGREAQVDRIIQLIESLELQSAVALKQWWKEQDTTGLTAMNKFVMRRQFMISFGRGAGYRIESEKREIIEETTGAELVIRNERQVAEDWARSKYSLGKARSSRMNGDIGAGAAGFSAGMKANVGTTAVGGGRKQVNA